MAKRSKVELFVFNWYKQVESSLHRCFQVRIASANLRWLSLSFFLAFLWVQRCNLFLSFFLLLFLVFSNPRLSLLLTVVFFLLNLDFRSIYQISPSFPSLPETFSVCLTLFFHLSFCVTLISVYINRVFFFFLNCFLSIVIVPKSEGASATANSDSLFD